MTSTVQQYLTEGCGRCALGKTPHCKVNAWRDELTLLRDIVLNTGLEETVKWGVPCYMFQNKNVVIVSALKDSCIISFMKGSLIEDKQGMLQKAGEHSHVARILKFTHINQIIESKQEIHRLILKLSI
jgi:Uncharacterized protein conserved in bacteria